MRVFGAAPGPVIALALIGLCMGLPLLFWLLKRAVRRLAGSLQVPIHGTIYALFVVVGMLLVGGGLVSLGLILTLRDYRGVGTKAFLAQVRCARVAPGQLRLEFVPIEGDGTHDATETVDATGDNCSVTGELIRFRPALEDLGLGAFARVVAPARQGAPPVDLPPWLRLERDGHHPLGYLLADQQVQTLAQAGQDNAGTFNLYATPSGYQLMPGGSP